MPQEYHYPGQELALFQKATRWKAYLAEQVRPYLRGAVLEVGAGLGATARLLNEGRAARWVMLEPDPHMFESLKEGQFPPNTELKQGTIASLSDRHFDTILYIDVLEHICDDAGELAAAAALLKPGGHLVVLSPAHQFLYSAFDKAIGHFRRYSAKTLKALTPPDLRLERMYFLDSAGYFASVANRLLLHQSYPTEKQVRFWDRYLVPVSRLADGLFRKSFGKSILAVWVKAPEV